MARDLEVTPAAPSQLAKAMPDTKSGNAGGDPKRRTADREGERAEAFDIWLQQGLHRLYDSVAKEPVPDELLRLIEQDRSDRAK